MDTILLAFLGYVLGALGRTVFGYLSKVIEAPETTSFDNKYWATMMISIILSFMTAAVTFNSLELPAIVNPTSLMLFTFALGYAANDVTNRGVNMIGSVSKGGSKNGE